MSHSDSARFTEHQALDGASIPAVVVKMTTIVPAELLWRNQLGGLTFRIGDRVVKWNPRHSGIDLDRERHRLQWLAGRHPVPRVLDFGSDTEAQWLVTEALPGESSVSETGKGRPAGAIRAIATGLRALHGIPITDFPLAWTAESWVGRHPAALGERPAVHDPVIVHGDACAPNTMISANGEWTGNVDFGDLAVGDRWADLAVASMSLDWNFGEGHQSDFFAAYGIKPDDRRISYYRALWDLES